MRLTGVESQQERLDKEADTATAPGEGWVRPCRDKTAHMGHYWPYYCYGVTEEGEQRMRFRSQQHHSATVTRDDEDYDGGLSTYRLDDEGPDRWRDR